MDEIAEKGLAAHFKYKGIKGEGGLDSWLARMREILESSEKEDNAFLDQVRSGLYTDEILFLHQKVICASCRPVQRYLILHLIFIPMLALHALEPRLMVRM